MVKGKIITYIIAVILIIASFILPPQGVVDPTVLCSVGLLIGGYEWLFGNNIKLISIDKEGIHIETHGN